MLISQHLYAVMSFVPPKCRNTTLRFICCACMIINQNCRVELLPCGSSMFCFGGVHYIEVIIGAGSGVMGKIVVFHFGSHAAE